MIEVEVGDTIVEFPDGTSQDLIKNVLRKKFNTLEKPIENPSFLSNVGDTLSGFKEGVNQGLTFGLIDEVANLTGSGLEYGVRKAGSLAGLAKAKDFNDIYADTRKRTLEIQNQTQQKAPIASALGNIAGAVGTGIAGGATKAGGLLANFLSQGGKVAQAVKGGIAGGGGGAIGGFGAGQGGLENRIDTAMQGAEYGVLGGAVAPSVGRGLQAGIKKGQELIGSGIEKVGKELVKKRALQLNLIKNLEPDDAVDRVAEKLIKDYPDPIRFKQAMDEALLDRKAIVNVGDSQTLSLADGASLFPSGRQKALETIGQQVIDEPDRLKSVLSKTISNQTNYTEALDNMLEIGRAKAKPLYNKAFENNQSLQSPVINRVLRTPAGQSALKEAIENVRNSGATKTTLDDIGNSEKLLKGMQDSADNIANSNQNVYFSLEALDHVKKGFDSSITTALRNNPSEASRLIELKRALVSELDNLDQSGLYLKARRTSGDYLSNKVAMEDGVKFLKDDAENVINNFKNYGTAEKESYRVGVIKSLRDNIEKSNDGRNVATFFKKEANRKKLKAILTPQEFKEVAKEANDADKLFTIKNKIFGNSATAERQIASQQFDSESIQVVKDLMQTASPTQAALGLLGRTMKRQFTGLSDKKAEEVAKVLFTRNPSMKKAYIDKLIQRSEQSSGAIRDLSKDSTDKAMQELNAFFTYSDLIKNLNIGKSFDNPLASQGITGSIGIQSIQQPNNEIPQVKEQNSTLKGLQPKQGKTPKPQTNNTQQPTSNNQSQLIDKFSNAESSGNISAKSTVDGSTSQGLYGFTDDTWRRAVNKFGKQYNVTINDRNNREAQTAMALALTQDNKRIAKNKLGRDVNDTQAYALHFLGAGQGVKFIKILEKNPNGIAKNIFPQEAKYNKNIFYNGKTPRTISEVYSVLKKKVS
jgi:hypothetical protein